MQSLSVAYFVGMGYMFVWPLIALSPTEFPPVGQLDGCFCRMLARSGHAG
jgi:hypothetical protein